MTPQAKPRQNLISLRTVLIVPFILEIALAVGLTGWLSIHNGSRAIEDLAGQLKVELTHRIHLHLDQYLGTPHNLGQTNEAAFVDGILDPQDLDTIGKHFWKQMQVFPVGYMSFGNPEGQFIGVGRMKDGRLSIDEKPELTPESPVYFYDTDDRGNRTQLRYQRSVYNPLIDRWYREPIEIGRPLWSPIYQWPLWWQGYDSQPSIAASRPVYDETGNLLGVIGIELPLYQIDKFLQEVQLSPSAQVFVVERSGRMVASSNPEALQGETDSSSPLVQSTNSAEPLVRETAQFLQQHFGSLESIEQTEQLKFRANGERQFLIVSPWQDEWGLDWLVVAVVPESDFMAQINANTRNTIVLCGVALALAIGLGIVTARWINRPLQRL
ncbi:MAG: cache domain-containing protein, partial [Cyanobacteria bacterium SBC]|nr:cache domain-containing protein [Cyanobacteria bacterium SBC]